MYLCDPTQPALTESRVRTERFWVHCLNQSATDFACRGVFVPDMNDLPTGTDEILCPSRHKLAMTRGRRVYPRLNEGRG